MPKAFTVTIWHNKTDDRWVYRIKGVKPKDMVYPLYVMGEDNFGSNVEGVFNNQTSGFLSEICECIADEIATKFDPSDSFEYEKGK